ncbi:phosphoribosylformylglycinamidine synthase-like [Sycon ciliatum]|uniref:phosphoribosylformylglycinamidine synthase-like n=1 Tax=Sycon ciliatum TaxID=27933 RepID=UPI0020ABC835|eukprot:scpid15561/ scgid20434/ Phosphoribosylformylglycinamidine synthase; Formylglycinamide ribotide amidotransferase; Formylglycinamide ribotide synthetase
MELEVLHFFKPCLDNPSVLQSKASALHVAVESCSPAQYNGFLLKREICYNVGVRSALSSEDLQRLAWLLECTNTQSALSAGSASEILVEIGPRLNFCTSWSTNAVSVCRAAGLQAVERVEQSIRTLIAAQDVNGQPAAFTGDAEKECVAQLHDRMTECRYVAPLTSFRINVRPSEVYDIEIMERGRDALVEANQSMGLALDAWDLDFYTTMFRDTLKRNPTSVECFDLAQSNSEHSRHWFFKGRMVIDGKEQPQSLLKMVMSTQDSAACDNQVIAFADDSSAIKGGTYRALCSSDPTRPSQVKAVDIDQHITFTAETHNFPTGVAPFSGATTGTGGRIRDMHAVGRGGHCIAGTAGYCFGNLSIPGYELPWENSDAKYPSNFAPPLEVAVEASNGASDYGNKFGEPVICGFARSFGCKLSNGERREWVKPIMFSGGIGSMCASHTKKAHPEVGMLVAKIGGPVYRIGVGGGAASSVEVQGTQASDLDFGAVQRGDAEMEQKLQRAIRGCIELGENNPICSIHDQGAGGNGNVLKEIVEPLGAVIRAENFELGDPTISMMELWGAEYQESDALLVQPQHREVLEKICAREKVSVSFVGEVTGNGRIELVHTTDAAEDGAKRKTTSPVDLPLDVVLGDVPRKTFTSDRCTQHFEPFHLPAGVSLADALDRVLRLPSVASKRYLTNKVDRSVTGLIAQQQCVGPLHTPLADVAVVALSHFSSQGAATAVGEQPVKMIVNPAAGARMAVAEALTNLMFAKVNLAEVKCSANWMWPAKLPGEGAAMYDACRAMSEVMCMLGVAVDGGKDSLSMAARVPGEGVVKAPGDLVVSTYVSCADVNATITPDLKATAAESTVLLWVHCGVDSVRLGGSALAQVYGSVGSECPDVDDVDSVKTLFNLVQSQRSLILAGHDVSDGGVLVTILEMAFAGNAGVEISVSVPSSVANPTEYLFTEEIGAVLQVRESDVAAISSASGALKVEQIGFVDANSSKVSVEIGGQVLLDASLHDLRDTWEATSFALERRQCNPACVEEEQATLRTRHVPQWNIWPVNAPLPLAVDSVAPRVGIIREEGSNGDREMAAAFMKAGFEVHDINSNDLCCGSITLESFNGLAFVGGFSYADVLGSARGWAATLRYNSQASSQLAAFRARSDTFSLGVCNGCQLLALLGWVGGAAAEHATNGTTAERSSTFKFTHNTSGRYESRFVNVRVLPSPAIMLRGMEGHSAGVWVAHGEGRLECDQPSLEHVVAQNLAPLRFVNDANNDTQVYPLNPNGSPFGITSLCSPDGRHLAMMPHPERTINKWSWPFAPSSPDGHLAWQQMFNNAFSWCTADSS